MKKKQFKNAGLLFFAQFIIKGSNFIKQLVLAYFLGVSGTIDLFLLAQLIPSIIASMFAGGAGEIILNAQTEDKNHNKIFNTLFVFLISIITFVMLVFYYFSLPITLDFFSIKPERVDVYLQLSLLIIISKVISATSSAAQNLILLENKYKIKILVNFLAEFIALLFIIFTVKALGIFSFAYALIINTVILFFFYGSFSKLNLKFLLIKNNWVVNHEKLKEYLKKVINLSGQTLVNHLSTFTERTLSARYLYDGYLSSLNYAKTLTALPNTIMLSSILTTTYIEQINQRKINENQYELYTYRAQKFIEKLAFFAQISLMFLAPLMIILIYKRGQFDTKALHQTFQLYQVLSIGFITSFMMSFFTRTMYIENHYQKLFKIILIKFFIEFSLMFALVKVTFLSIPIALIIGNLWVTLACFFILKKHNNQMFNYNSFYLYIFLSIISSCFIAVFNIYLLPYLIHLNKFYLTLHYLPLLLIIILLFFIIFKDYEVIKKMLKKIKK